MCVGAAVAVAAVVADRLFALHLNNWLLVGAPIGAALIGACLVALTTPRNLLRAAAEVDRALALQDRLGTGIALHDRRDDPFAAIAVEDAEAAARDVRISRAAPLRLGASWWVWPIALSAAVACAIFLPVIDIVNREAEAARQASLVAERERAAAALAEAREAFTPPDAPMEDLATPTELAILEDLEKQLAAGNVDPDEARAKAASALSESARELERIASAQEEHIDALRDELKSMSADDAPESPLSKALSQGDFAEAQRLIDQYRQALDQLDAQERQAIAEELQRAADSIRTESPEIDAQPPAPSEESLRDLGVDDQTIDALKEQTDPEAIRDRLREEGVDEPVAERLADELARENQEHQAQEQARDDARRLKEALEESAREVSEPEREQPRDSGDAPTEPQQGADQQEKRSEQSPTGEPDQDQREGQEPRQDQTGQGETRRDSEKQSPQEQPSRGEESPDGEPSPQRGPEGPQQLQQPSPGESPDGAPQTPQPGEPSSPSEQQQQQQQQPTQSPGQPQSPAQAPDQHGEPEEGDGQPQPGAAPSPDGAQPEGMGQGPTPTSDEKGLERAKRLMEEFQKREQGAKEQREQAQRARERAQKLLEEMSPEQREQLQRWAQELSREKRPSEPAPPPSGGFANEMLDLRPREESPDRVIAQWFNPDAPTGGEGAVSRRVVDDQLQEAAKGAERAVEEQAVHRRYNDIIKRYFDAVRKKSPE